MKKLVLIFAIGILLGFTTQAKPVNPPAGFGMFFSVLNPHGSWIELDYGMVVWRPTIIRRGWAPYRMGQWVWTVDGWYWDSYEPFGHVTYHYGRWFYDDYYGWLWVPDYEWAPAWVEWRYDDAYIGWAPLHPYAVFTINVGIRYTYDYYTPYTHWHFVTYRHFNDPYVYNHFIGHKNKHGIYNRTKYRTNYDYYDGRVVNRGVDIDYVRKRTGRDIRTRDLDRVRDYSQFEGNRTRNGRDDDRIRTFYVPKDELQKNEREFTRDNIKRSERKTSLDITRVELGDRRDMKRDDRTRETVTTRNDERKDIRNERDVKRTEIDNNRKPVLEKRNDEIKREEKPVIQERKEVQLNTRENKRNTEMEKQRVNDNKRTIEIEKQRINENNRNNQIQKQRDEEVNRTRVYENQKTERKNTEIKQERNNDRQREVQRTETRNERKNETRVERNNGNTQNRNDRKR